MRALLAVSMIAVIGLTITVVILAVSDDRATVAGSATELSAPAPADGIRYDGGPEEGFRGLRPSSSIPAPPAGIRYDGGPEEGTSDALGSNPARSSRPGIRYDGGPEEGTSGLAR